MDMEWGFACAEHTKNCEMKKKKKLNLLRMNTERFYR